MAAFARQIFGGDGLAVQRVGDGGGDGQRLVGGTLPAVVTLYVLGVGQRGLGLLRGVGVVLAVLLTDNDLPGAAVGIGDDVYRLSGCGGGAFRGGPGLCRLGGRTVGVLLVGGKGGDTGQTAGQYRCQPKSDDLCFFIRLPPVSYCGKDGPCPLWSCR